MRTRLGHDRHRRWSRLATAIAVAITSGGLAVVAAPAPAFAGTSAPIAVGAGSFNDVRTWEIVGTAAASRVRMTGYRVGISGSTVDNQRWQWELVASSATAGLTWRIHNIASGLCLDKNSANAVVISACGTATSQRWQAPLDDPYGGWTLRNTANAQCLQVVGSSTADGALLQTASCIGSDAQRWRLRTAPLDCTVRSGDWTSTDLCASQSGPRMVGVTANWRSYPVRMNWLDPNLYYLTHIVNTYVQVEPLNPDYSQSYTGLEFGSSAERSIEPSGTVSYRAYWLEWGETSQQYHELTTADAPRSDTADGRNHTFMALGKGDAGQWDLLYDYNTVATTTLLAGGSTRESRAGLAVRYLQAAATDTPFTIRMQLMDGNQTWRRPYLGETGTGEPKTCETPPRYEDWTYDTVNLPPNCFTAATATRAPDVSTDPLQLDAFTVAKPGTTTVAAAAPQPAIATAPVAQYNGVDQQALANCLERDAGNCLGRVPGLAACVAARAVCNTTGTGAVTRSVVPPMTATQARDKALRTFHLADGKADGKATGEQAAVTTTTLNRGSGGTVYVVASSARVRSLSVSHQATYDGYVAVYDAATQRLLSACLGATCEVPS